VQVDMDDVVLLFWQDNGPRTFFAHRVRAFFVSYVEHARKRKSTHERVPP
jgi:hypothetical protein